MLKDILGRRELYDEVKSRIKNVLGSNLVAIVVFGSTIYVGEGEDVDLVVVVNEEIDLKEKLKLEHKVRQVLQKAVRGKVFDVHIFSLEEFKENLQPGTLLSGLALGYEVIYGEEVVEPLILNFLRKLSNEKYVLHNKYGTWDLSFHAKITWKLRSRRALTRKGT